MKTTLTVLFFTLYIANGFCQNQSNTPQPDIAKKVAAIDTYIKQLEQNQKLSAVRVYDDPRFIEHSIYTKTNMAFPLGFPG